VPALDEKKIRPAFEKFRGDFYQTPPMVSAIKHSGVPLYKLARQGKTVEREPRLVHVYRYSIDRIALPKVDFTVVCSKGFYVRTYAHDIGAFDGVHLGHQAVISTSARHAHSEDGTPVVVTFDPHPAKVLRPENPPHLITSTPHNIALIRALGVGHLLIISFDKNFAQTE